MFCTSYSRVKNNKLFIEKTYFTCRFRQDESLSRFLYYRRKKNAMPKADKRPSMKNFGFGEVFLGPHTGFIETIPIVPNIALRSTTEFCYETVHDCIYENGSYFVMERLAYNTIISRKVGRILI
jgi:hypothetical protein